MEEQLEKVIAFEYLIVVIFTNDGKVDLEISNRINKTTRIYYSLQYKITFGKKEYHISANTMLANPG